MENRGGTDTNGMGETLQHLEYSDLGFRRAGDVHQRPMIDTGQTSGTLAINYDFHTRGTSWPCMTKAGIWFVISA